MSSKASSPTLITEKYSIQDIEGTVSAVTLLGREPMAPGVLNGILAHGQGGWKNKRAGQGQPGLDVPESRTWLMI